MRIVKQIYRVRNRKTGEYVSLGYNNKSTWSVFPSSAIRNSSYRLTNPADYEVDVFETVLVKSLTLEGKELT